VIAPGPPEGPLADAGSAAGTGSAPAGTGSAAAGGGSAAAIGTTRPRKVPADQDVSRAANKRWWDEDADAYHAEHGEFLGEADLVWCPENLRESEAHLLGEVRGRRILEVGCGSAPCSRYLAQRGAEVVAFDLSAGMLAHARAGAARTGISVPLVQADVCELPFSDACFDLAFSAFGAIPFVADSVGAMREVARVLRPGGVFVYAGVHPVFASPFALPQEDGTTMFQPGYRVTGWHTVSRYPDRPGIRSKVGVNHIPLAGLFNAVLDTGLTLVRVDEPRTEDPPLAIAFRAEKR